MLISNFSTCTNGKSHGSVIRPRLVLGVVGKGPGDRGGASPGARMNIRRKGRHVRLADSGSGLRAGASRPRAGDSTGVGERVAGAGWIADRRAAGRAEVGGNFQGNAAASARGGGADNVTQGGTTGKLVEAGTGRRHGRGAVGDIEARLSAYRHGNSRSPGRSRKLGAR